MIVFGSINVDLIFRVPSLPREGETVLTDSFATIPGGKGANQAVAAARALSQEAEPVILAGCIGNDSFAELALSELKSAGVDLRTVKRVHRPTGCAAITVDHAGRNQITVASGANLETSHNLVDTPLLKPGVIVLLQNEVSESENLALARRAAERGGFVILNAAPARTLSSQEWAGLLSVLVVNEKEAETITGSTSVAALSFLAKELRATVVATLGSQGALAVTPHGPGWRVSALPLEEVIDTTGAGDTFVGALAAALQGGQPLEEALRFASAAGGLACTRPGAQPSAPSRADILDRLRDLGPAQPLHVLDASRDGL